MNILVADDDPVQSRLLEKHLTGRGFKVQIAFDASTAWEKVQKERPDAILLDLLMPGGTGLGLLKKRNGSSSHRNLPVIVITAVEDPLVLRMVEQSGVVSIMPKPVDLMLLDVTLESVRSSLPAKPAMTPGR
ncbi:MAG TPA: response regulator [Candidatus Acidoferrales bacterium]|nr:response regulator [Candidatus Acidoferrales bacterium]